MHVHRPTLPLHVWDSHPEIIGGRDLVNGGTWLAVTPTGRFAFVTNFREVLRFLFQKLKPPRCLPMVAGLAYAAVAATGCHVKSPLIRLGEDL